MYFSELQIQPCVPSQASACRRPRRRVRVWITWTTLLKLEVSNVEDGHSRLGHKLRAWGVLLLDWVSTCYTASLESTLLKETYRDVQMKRHISNLERKNKHTDEGRNILKIRFLSSEVWGIRRGRVGGAKLMFWLLWQLPPSCLFSPRASHSSPL